MAKKIEAENSIDTTKNEEIKDSKKVVEEKNAEPKKQTTKKATKAKSSTKKSTTKETEQKAKTSTTKESTTTKTSKTTTKKAATTSTKKESEEEADLIEEVAVAPKEEVVKIEEIKKTIKNKKVVPKEEIQKINKSLFTNIIVAICIIIYFIFLNLGQMNIKPDVYVTDLKVFSMCTLLTAIALLEVAYKKDSGEIALYGVEMIVLALATVALIYVNLMLSTRYVYIVSAISYIFAIYYLIKSIVIYLKKKRQYFVNDMKEIMNKDE